MQVNPECLELIHEGINIDGLPHLRTGGAKGFSIHHDNVKVATDRPITEGADVHVCISTAIELVRLEPPQDVPSLRVEGLAVTINLVDFCMLHSNIQA
jgi:hypothetical protein